MLFNDVGATVVEIGVNEENQGDINVVASESIEKERCVDENTDAGRPH